MHGLIDASAPNPNSTPRGIAVQAKDLPQEKFPKLYEVYIQFVSRAEDRTIRPELLLLNSYSNIIKLPG